MGEALTDYDIYVDGEKIDQIANNRTKKFELNLTEGKHIIYVKKGIEVRK